MVKAQRWQDTWNWYRRHGGIGMGGKTPIEKLKETGVMIHEHIGSFPVLLMEEWMMGYDLVMKFTNSFLKTGYYVQTKCRKLKMSGLTIFSPCKLFFLQSSQFLLSL